MGNQTNREKFKGQNFYVSFNLWFSIVIIRKN
jgi:hypothetical protein